MLSSHDELVQGGQKVPTLQKNLLFLKGPFYLLISDGFFSQRSLLIL